MFRRLFPRILLALGALLVLSLTLGFALGLWRQPADSLRPLAEQLRSQAIVASALAKIDPRRRDPAWEKLLALDFRFAEVAPSIDQSSDRPQVRALKQALDQLLDNPFLVRIEDQRELRIWLAVGQEPNVWVGQRIQLDSGGNRSSFALIALGLVLLLIAAAYWAARELASPIERLADNADELIRGRADPKLLRGVPAELRELATSLTQAGASRSNALRERELILAGLSHDLRTPLSRIRLALELGDAHTDEGRGAMAADIEEIDAIVRQFIDYVRSGREESPKEVDLGPLLNEVVHQNGGNMKNWTLKIGEAPKVIATPLALQRALANLIVNARRHAAPPYTATLVAPDSDHVAITITDEGTGIPLDLHRRIGEPFLTRESRTRTGSGLGLAIVSRIVRRHGGRLEMMARQPRGTLARIVLPLDPGAMKLDES